MRGQAFIWTKERDDILRAIYSEQGARAAAEALGIGIRTVYERASKLRLTRRVVHIDNQEKDYIKHVKRIQALKDEAAKGTLRGHRVLSLYQDKVVLEIKARDQASYKECFTFNELALSK